MAEAEDMVETTAEGEEEAAAAIEDSVPEEGSRTNR